MTKDLLAAHRYAQALFELVHEFGEDETVEAELESLSAALVASPETERFLGDPALTIGQKRQIVEKLFCSDRRRVDEVMVKFLLLLFKKNRFYLIHDIAVHFRRIADESQGQGVAEIRSAAPLGQTQREAIISRIEKIAGKKMVVHSEVDASLVGGVVIRLGNRLIDDSARTKIGYFKKELMKAQSI